MTVFILELLILMTTHWAYAFVLMSPMVLAEVDVRARVLLGALLGAESDGASLSKLGHL
jgi:hypothetical protein